MLATLSTANAATLTGRSFFPHLISDPFRTGLHEAFAFSVAACTLAALMSWSRGGGRYVSSDTADAGEDEYATSDGFVAH